MSKPRVLVIALAEATLDLIKPWVEAGELPTFKKLMDEGSWGPLRSRMPLITPQMWGTIVTGKNPGEHGAFDFRQRGPDGKFHPVDGSFLKAKPIWKLLSERNLYSGVVNVPFTYPPQAINGFMISGEDAPGAHRSIAAPSSVYDEVVEKFGRYRLKDIFPGGRKKEDYLTLIEEDVTKQTEVLEHLVSQKPWDFFLVFFSATAIAQHYFWSDMESNDARNPFRDVVKTAYRCLDTAVGKLIAAAGPDATVFVISDCGAGKIQSGVQINTWLEQEGFLARKEPKPKAAVSEKQEKPKSGGSRHLIATLRKKVQGVMPQGLYFWVNNTFGGVKDWIQDYLADSDIDWSKTQISSRGKEGDLFVNLKGRDPHGVVNPGAEYEAVRDRLIERLSKLVDPATGLPAVDRVYKREELYQGPMLEWAPDLIIGWRDTLYQPTESDKDKDKIFVARWREYMDWPTTGSHRMDGICFVKGPKVRRGQRIDGMGIADLMPTWLAAANQPVPADVEGRVISNLFVGGAA